MSNRKATAVASLAELFGRELSKPALKLFVKSLSQITDEQAEQAAAVAASRCKFMPTPSDLIELATSQGTSYEHQATQAWQCLSRAVERHGAAKSVNFRDAVINATVRTLGGWERICGLTSEEFEKWLRKEFDRTYMRFSREGCPGHLTQPLIGSTERENSKFEGKLNPRTGQPYSLPAVVEIEASYQPAVLALPAPERKPAELPKLELKTVDTEEPIEELPKRNRMPRKKEIPAAHKQDWNTKEDLEFDLNEEQLQEQEANREKLIALNPKETP